MYQTELTPTPPAFIEGINDPEGWSNFCRTVDALPKNALKKLAPKYSATVSLRYFDAENKTREILNMEVTSPDDAADLALLLASLAKPNSQRIVIITPSNATAYEAFPFGAGAWKLGGFDSRPPA